MRQQFRQFIPLTKTEVKAIWKNAIIIPDANFLLQVYRYSDKSKNEFFKVLSHRDIVDRLWIPYQVGFEFYNSKEKVILEQISIKDTIESLIINAENKLMEGIKNLPLRTEHPFLTQRQLEQIICKGISLIKNEINKVSENHPDRINNDDLLEKICELFSGKVGEKFDNEQLVKFKKEAEQRYKDFIPPGYADSGKDNNKYGDYIIWREIIRKSKELSKPVIFITNDVKEDWWLQCKGKKIGIRYELRGEFFNETGQEIKLYMGDSFIKFAKENFKIQSKDENLLKEMQYLQERERIRDYFYHFNKNVSFHETGMEPSVILKILKEAKMSIQKENVMLLDKAQMLEDGDYYINNDALLRKRLFELKEKSNLIKHAERLCIELAQLKKMRLTKEIALEPILIMEQRLSEILKVIT
jgi:hypothetical protein